MVPPRETRRRATAAALSLAAALDLSGPAQARTVEQINAGVGIGGEYGEGVLRVGGRSVAYYSFASASVGLQVGFQKKDIIILFLADEALRRFQARGPNEGWQVGVDGSIVLVDAGANASVDSAKINQPIVGFGVGQKGLMVNLTLEGSKITKLSK